MIYNILLYFLVLFLIVVMIIYIIIMIKENRLPKRDYLPFAFLPEINISQTPALIQNDILNKIFPTVIPKKYVDQDMFIGKYQRYPLGKKKLKTSIVAVDSGISHNNIKAWQVEVSVENWNIVWGDVYSAYWVSLVSCVASPVVVIKGRYPRCRYFSYYSYVGLEFTDDGKIYMGKAINKDATNVCNSTIPDDCKGLKDVDIEPDEGSKNPFTDPTYKEGDDDYYTIYFVSPYYKGRLPKSKNILPMTIQGFTSAAIMYRLYAPFNPKSCGSPYYNSSLPFHTDGCVPPHPTPSCKENYSNDTKFKISDIDGGAAYPYLDKSSFCKTGDTNCIQSCIGNEIAENGLENDCIKYVGNNRSCVCDPENYYGKCGQFLDKTIRKCTNNNGTLSSLCQSAPKLKVDWCIDKIQLSDKYPVPITSTTTCDDTDPLCQYVKQGKIQQCVADLLYKNNDDPDCQKYKNPNNFPYVCDEIDAMKNSPTCLKTVGGYVYTCFTGKKDEPSDQKKKFYATQYCSQNPPHYKYHPTYFYDLNKIECPSSGCAPSSNDRVEDLKEDFKCINHFKEEECDPTKLPYQNIRSYYTNTVNSSLLTMSGWVGLPEVFLKYQYNDYFIRTVNEPSINTKLNIFPMIKSFKNYIQGKNWNDPTNVFQIMDNNTDREPNREGFEIFDDNEFENEDTPPCPNPSTKKPSLEEVCPEYVDYKTYFQIGAQFKGKGGKTTTIKGPGCDYYNTLCTCVNKGKNNAGKCNDQQPGNLDCLGVPCFNRWKLENDCTQFIGTAVPFSISSNTSDVIVFPNPDNQYIGCPTTLLPSTIYVIWMDVPMTPITPGFENIQHNDYHLRYWSIGHYLWESNLLNPRPVLSSIMDQDTKTHDVNYIDLLTKRPVSGKRACFILCTQSQYELLKKKRLWDDRIQWLNWGKTKLPTPPEDLKLLVKTILVDVKNLAPNLFNELAKLFPKLFENLFDIEITDDDTDDKLFWLLNVLDDLPDLIRSLHDLKCLNSDELRRLIQELLKLVDELRNPARGVILLRQLLPNKDFDTSILNYVNSDPVCLRRNIPIKQSSLKTPSDYQQYEFAKDPSIEDPPMISKACNPGNKDVCNLYGLDPCCLCRDLLPHMKQYYPRCEKLDICELEKINDPTFWEKYFGPLPYDYNVIPLS